MLLSAPDLLSEPPHHLSVDGGARLEVEGWAGPWPLQQRWWTPGGGVQASRLQLLCPGGAAYLLISHEGRWWVTGIYD